MKLRSLAFGATALMGLIAFQIHNAKADPIIFNWTYTDSLGGYPGSPYEGSGTLTATPISGGPKYQIDTITGTLDGDTITGLLATGMGFAPGTDNDLYYPSPFSSPDQGDQLDAGGLGIVVTTLGNIQICGGGPSLCGNGNPSLPGNPDGLAHAFAGFGIEFDTGDFSATPQATPLPSALSLFATALCLIGLLGWRKKRKVQTIAA